MLLCKLAACHKKKNNWVPLFNLFCKRKKKYQGNIWFIFTIKKQKKQKQDSEPIWLDWAVISGLCDIVLG